MSITDAAKIDIISESSKYFSDYFKFFRVKPTIFDKEVRGTGLGYDGCYDSVIDLFTKKSKTCPSDLR